MPRQTATGDRDDRSSACSITSWSTFSTSSSPCGLQVGAPPPPFGDDACRRRRPAARRSCCRPHRSRVRASAPSLRRARCASRLTCYLACRCPCFAPSSPIRAAALAVALAVCGVLFGASAAARRRPLRATRTSARCGSPAPRSTSPTAIAAVVRAPRRGGFNTLLVQVRGRGDAYYDSDARTACRRPRPATRDFDPLADVPRRARTRPGCACTRGSTSTSSRARLTPSRPPRSTSSIRHPGVADGAARAGGGAARRRPPEPGLRRAAGALDAARAAAEVEGLYASPIHPARRRHTSRPSSRDLVTRYAVDGIHLDYVRFPGDDFDYSRGALARVPHVALAAS